MIYEIASITIDPENKIAFEVAVGKAATLFKAAKGCYAMKLECGIENPNQYRLVVEWESVDAHIVDFRESEAFQQWRALVGLYFLIPPVVIHSKNIAVYF